MPLPPTAVLSSASSSSEVANEVKTALEDAPRISSPNLALSVSNDATQTTENAPEDVAGPSLSSPPRKSPRKRTHASDEVCSCRYSAYL